MALKKVWIEEGCTECELCVDISSQVFEMGEYTAVVKDDVDINTYEDSIIEAADSCPVEVIKYE